MKIKRVDIVSFACVWFACEILETTFLTSFFVSLGVRLAWLAFVECDDDEDDDDDDGSLIPAEPITTS